MPRKAGGARRKRRTHPKLNVAAGTDGTPRSFVLRRGKVPVAVRDLVPDLRTAFMPHTAAKLKERKSNNIRDYTSIATQLGVTHFWIFSATERGPYLRVGKVPQGPTLTFRIAEYSLATDVRATQRRPVALQDIDFEEPPLLVLNNFSSGKKGADPSIELMAETFRHSFPAIDVNSTRLSTMRRVLLINRDQESGLVHIRHYSLRVQATGLSRPVRKMVTRGRIPKLAKLADVSELMDGAGPPGVFSSDSEMDDGNTQSHVTLAQPVQKLRRGANSSIKLVEVGPRLTLELVKIQSGLCDGAVLFHKYHSKEESQVAMDQERIDARKALKRKRRDDQKANVEKKRDVKRAKKERHKKSVEARIAAEERAAEIEAADTESREGSGEEDHERGDEGSEEDDSEKDVASPDLIDEDDEQESDSEHEAHPNVPESRTRKRPNRA